MKKTIFHFLLLLATASAIVSCSDKCDPQPEPTPERAFRLAIDRVEQASVIDDYPAYVAVDIYTVHDSSVGKKPKLSYDTFFSFFSSPQQLSIIGIKEGEFIFYATGCSYDRYGKNSQNQTIWIVAEEGTYRIHLTLQQPIINKFYITPEYDLTMTKDEKGQWSAELNPVQ